MPPEETTSPRTGCVADEPLGAVQAVLDWVTDLTDDQFTLAAHYATAVGNDVTFFDRVLLTVNSNLEQKVFDDSVSLALTSRGRELGELDTSALRAAVWDALLAHHCATEDRHDPQVGARLSRQLDWTHSLTLHSEGLDTEATHALLTLAAAAHPAAHPDTQPGTQPGTQPAATSGVPAGRGSRLTPHDLVAAVLAAG